MADTGQLKNYFGREKSKIIWALPPSGTRADAGALEKRHKDTVKIRISKFSG